MFNENLQEYKVDELNKYLENNPYNPQVLLLSAYLEEKQKWNNKLLLFKEDILNKQMILYNLENLKENSSFLHNLYWKVLGRNKLLDKEIEKHKVNLIKLKSDCQIVFNNPPNQIIYNLAMFGSNIFSAK